MANVFIKVVSGFTDFVLLVVLVFFCAPDYLQGFLGGGHFFCLTFSNYICKSLSTFNAKARETEWGVPCVELGLFRVRLFSGTGGEPAGMVGELHMGLNGGFYSAVILLGGYPNFSSGSI